MHVSLCTTSGPTIQVENHHPKVLLDSLLVIIREEPVEIPNDALGPLGLLGGIDKLVSDDVLVNELEPKLEERWGNGKGLRGFGHSDRHRDAELGEDGNGSGGRHGEMCLERRENGRFELRALSACVFALLDLMKRNFQLFQIQIFGLPDLLFVKYFGLVVQQVDDKRAWWKVRGNVIHTLIEEDTTIPPESFDDVISVVLDTVGTTDGSNR